MGTPAPDTHPAHVMTGGPAEPVPVAILARTSTMALQDPVASIRRQIRSCQEWLPPGWQVVACYWDVESGALNLEQRGHGTGHEQFAAAGLPRDGGLADLLNQARSPQPSFAAVIVEDIERASRDTFNSLKLEKQLSEQGIPLFATDEPAHIDGINPTTVLVRRVKQGVAEWYRLQVKEKAWKGMKEHSLAGWNTGPVPYGYLPEKVPHPVPVKAAEGRTKTRLAVDPVRGPVITQIFTWRVVDKLGLPTIAARLNADPAAYPPPTAGIAWTAPALHHILTNPKYTGYMVLGRRRKTGGRLRPVPPSEWLWSPEPTHAALIDRDTWDAAQVIGAERGNVRDAGMPAQGRRRYVLRSRIRCRACKRRMRGATHVHHPGNGVTYAYTYYRCPHTEANPNHAAAHPDHPYVAVREDALMKALATFFKERVFGPDRAAMLADRLPKDAADHQARRDKQAAALRKQLARIDVAENALLTELETPADPGDKAAQALRNRIRARFKDLYEQRTSLEAQLAALQAPAERDDPSLLDELPYLGDILTSAPPRLTEQLLEAFGIQAVYNKDMHQVTIYATLTDATPQAIADLLADPRADHNQQSAPATEQDHLRHSVTHTPAHLEASLPACRCLPARWPASARPLARCGSVTRYGACARLAGHG